MAEEDYPDYGSDGDPLSGDDQRMADAAAEEAARLQAELDEVRREREELRRRLEAAEAAAATTRARDGSPARGSGRAAPERRDSGSGRSDRERERSRERSRPSGEQRGSGSRYSEPPRGGGSTSSGGRAGRAPTPTLWPVSTLEDSETLWRAEEELARRPQPIYPNAEDKVAVRQVVYRHGATDLSVGELRALPSHTAEELYKTYRGILRDAWRQHRGGTTEPPRGGGGGRDGRDPSFQGAGGPSRPPLDPARYAAGYLYQLLEEEQRGGRRG